MTPCGIDTKSNTACPRSFFWIWHLRGGVFVFTILSSWLKGVPSTTVSWYESSFFTSRIQFFFANSVDMKFPVTPELIIAIAITPDNCTLILK